MEVEKIRLSELRKRNKLSQQKLGKDLGMSGGAIGMYEAGVRTPSLNTAMKIAKYFDVRVDEIQFSNDTEVS